MPSRGWYSTSPGKDFRNHRMEPLLLLEETEKRLAQGHRLVGTLITFLFALLHCPLDFYTPETSVDFL